MSRVDIRDTYAAPVGVAYESRLGGGREGVEAACTVDSGRSEEISGAACLRPTFEAFVFDVSDACGAFGGFEAFDIFDASDALGAFGGFDAFGGLDRRSR